MRIQDQRFSQSLRFCLWNNRVWIFAAIQANARQTTEVVSGNSTENRRKCLSVYWWRRETRTHRWFDFSCSLPWISLSFIASFAFIASAFSSSWRIFTWTLGGSRFCKRIVSNFVEVRTILASLKMIYPWWRWRLLERRKLARILNKNCHFRQIEYLWFSLTHLRGPVIILDQFCLNSQRLAQVFVLLSTLQPRHLLEKSSSAELVCHSKP